MNNYSKFLDKKIFNIVGKCADKLNYETYVVGGWVRDLLMGRIKKNTDIDFVCVGSGIKLAEEVQKLLGKKAKFQVFKNFGTALVYLENENYEFVGARSESYRKNSRKPIIENGTLHEDQLRRDFTINALAIRLNKKDFGKLIDPFNGKQDIIEQVIVTPLDPCKTFSDDPLRMMRAVRFASELNFSIKKSILDSIEKNRKRLAQAKALDNLLEEKNTSINIMLSLKVEDSELIKRLLNRGKGSGRSDDQDENIIANRINEYNNKTAPLKDYYSKQNKLQEIDGIGSIEEIASNLNQVIENL